MTEVRVPIAAAQAGDTLACAVCDAAGHVLLPAQTVLSAATLASLARREVAELSVVRPEVIDPAQQAVRRIEIEQQLQTRFRRAGQGQATQLLYQAALAHFLERGR